jgi:DNA invertase Pin-like site-specific DNA recombinase
MARQRKPAFAYLRTSAAGSGSGDTDSGERQRKSIAAFAKGNGYDIAGEYYDAAVSGADPMEARPGFTALLAAIAGNGCRTIVVETANRFARDLMVQEVGFAMLQGLGITLIAADSPSSFLDDGPTSKLIRQILGAVSEFDKAMIVAKLAGARARVRRSGRKCEGRKSIAEMRPDTVALAKQLKRELPRPSLRDLSAALADHGHVNGAGNAYSASAVKRMLASRDRLPRSAASPGLILIGGASSARVADDYLDARTWRV